MKNRINMIEMVKEKRKKKGVCILIVRDLD